MSRFPICRLFVLAIVAAAAMSLAAIPGCSRNGDGEHEHPEGAHEGQMEGEHEDEGQKPEGQKEEGEKEESTDASAAQNAEMQKLLAAYPLDTCVISGEKLGEHGEPFDYMHEGKLVRFCCDSCVPDFKEEPAKHLAKISEARKPSS